MNSNEIPKSKYNFGPDQQWQIVIIEWADTQGFDVWLDSHSTVMRNLSRYLADKLGEPK